jgi:hypothetical protein
MNLVENTNVLNVFKEYISSKYPNLSEVVNSLGRSACASSFTILLERILFLDVATPKLLKCVEKVKGKMFEHFKLSPDERESAEYYYVHSSVPVEMREFVLEKDLTGLAKLRLEKN